MQDGSLRRVLLMETRDLHETLDQAVGGLEDAAAYRGFVTGSYAFRATVEPWLAGGGWRVQPLATLIAQDLADLGQARPALLPAPALSGLPARAAGCYVLEGSALGARLLQRRAVELGFDADHGARHLAAQAGARDRWPRFLAWLDQAEIPAAEAVRAAREVFVLALRSYGVKVAA